MIAYPSDITGSNDTRFHKDDSYELYMHNEHSLLKIYVNLYIMNVSSIYLNDADK